MIRKCKYAISDLILIILLIGILPFYKIDNDFPLNRINKKLKPTSYQPPIHITSYDQLME